MGSLVASPDASSQTTSASTLPGVTWMSHLAGDVPILAWALVNTATPSLDATFTTPTGGNVVDTNVRGIIATKTTTGSESGDVSLSCDAPSANRMVGALALFRGYTGIAQIVSLGEASGTAVTTHACPTITPTVAGSAFVMVYLDRVSTGNTTVTPPAGFTKAVEFGTSGSGGTYLQICYDLSGTRGLTPFTPASWSVAVGSTSAIVFLIELPPSGSAFTGTLGLSGAGTLALAGKPAPTGALTLSGSGQIAGAGTVAVGGSLGLSGAGTATDAGAPALTGSAALAGAGTLTETGTPAASGAASLSGSGTLTETGKPGFAGTTALSGAGALTTAGQPMLPGTLSLTGGGTLTGLAGNNFAGAANLSGAGGLGLAGSPAVPGSLGLSSAGQLAFAAAPAFARTVALTGAGQLALAGAASIPGALALSGSGDLALAGALAARGALVLSGAGALDPSGVETPVGEPGHLVATDSGPTLHPTNSSPVLAATHSAPTVAATNQPSSRLEASHDL